MCDDKVKEVSRQINEKIVSMNDFREGKDADKKLKEMLDEMLPGVDFGDIHATGIGITRISIGDDGEICQEEVDPAQFFKDMKEMEEEEQNASLKEKVLTWWWNLKRKFIYKHDFVVAGYKETFIPPMRFPVYQCTKCMKTHMLEPWQMEQLPRSMKYGCIARGKGDASRKNETHS